MVVGSGDGGVWRWLKLGGPSPPLMSENGRCMRQLTKEIVLDWQRDREKEEIKWWNDWWFKSKS